MQLSILQRLFVVAWLGLAFISAISGPIAAAGQWKQDEGLRSYDESRLAKLPPLPAGFQLDHPAPTRRESFDRMLSASREAALITTGVVLVLAVPLAALQFVCLGSPLPAASWRPRVRA